MEFFHLLKASQKSGKKDAVIWFTAKSAARANLQLDVALEEAGIEETGRGKDYAKPIRTDFPVVNDLPEEGIVDYTWCDRYTLGEDGRSWIPVLGEAGAAAAPVVNVETQPTQPAAAADAELRPVSRLRLIQRLLAHLMHDTELDQITLEQHMEIGVMEFKDENRFVLGLRQAIADTPELQELSAHVEWKLIKAVKAVFPQHQSHEAERIALFVKGWVQAEVSDRAQLVEDWLSGELPAPELADNNEPGDGEFISAEGVMQEGSPEAAAQAEELVQEFREKDMTVLHAVPTLSFRHRLLAQFITEKEYAYHIDDEQLTTVRQLEMDTDNSYVQNLLLAAENVEGMKKLRDFEFWRLTDAVKRVFPAEKATPDLSLMLQFMKAWKTTDYIDRGLLAKEWINGNRVSTIQRTDTGTNAGGGIKTDRNADYEHTLDTLDVEIACATLPMDFDIYNIPGSIHRRAKEIVAAKESPWKEWSAALRKTAGILDYSRAAIFALIREASSGITPFPDRMTGYISATLNEYKHDTPEARILAAARQIDRAAVVAGVIQGTEPVEKLEALSTEYAVVGKAAAEAAQSHHHETIAQPEVANLGGGVFSIEGLLATPSNEVAKQEVDHVQMEETDPSKVKAGAEVSAVEGVDAAAAQAGHLSPAEILAAAAPELASSVTADLDQNIETLSQDEPELPKTEPETPVIEPAADIPEPEAAAQQCPAYFEPGRYEGLPNDVYHAANGISSTMVKDARVSLMYFEARHVSKTIQKERSKVLDMGNLVHALALQPETLAAEFSIEPEIPEGALTTTATIRACIDEYNASLSPQLSADDIKALLEARNATLPASLPLGGSADETYASYEQLPEEYQRIENGTKHTATAMKACIKEYNATLPAPVKTTGSRDALLEQLAIVNPDLVAQEAQKPVPLKVSGTKADMIQALKAVRPTTVFADELLDAWCENPASKVLVTRQQYTTALAIQKALHAHPTAGKLLLHPDRAVETSYFGIDEETGLEIRVRPDLELDVDGVRIGADLKTISMWNIKQSGLRAKLHREIIDRDYHLSAGMYMETASLDQFFWIFVNKDEGYHWIAIVEASPELVELGILEYRATMRAIANAFDTGEWPAPITDDYTDELTDYDLRRLEALRTA